MSISISRGRGRAPNPRAARWLAPLALALALAMPSTAAADPVPGQYIVTVKDGASLDEVIAGHRRGAQAQLLHTYRHALRGYSAKLSVAGLRAVKADPRVESVTQDTTFRVTFASAKQPPPPPPPPEGGALPTGVNRIDADLRFDAFDDVVTESDVDVAVVDTGVQVNHPDLNVVGGVNCLGTAVSSDGTYGDEYGHGTHVAGIVGARDDRNGVVGVAPGARIWSVRVAGPGGLGTQSTQLCGLDWVTANGPALGIETANASMALVGKADDGNCGYSANDIMHKAICRSTAAGMDWVFAAGNGGGDYKMVAGASYNEVLAVTSVADANGTPGGGGSFGCSVDKGTMDDKHAISSNYAVSTGDQSHTIAGPGVCIQSTWIGSTWATKTGTSMAAPHVAATLALCIRSGECAGTPADNIQEMRWDAAAYNQLVKGYGFTGDPIRPITGRYYGYLTRTAGY